MKIKFISTLLAVYANLILIQAFYGPKDNVVELTPQNFRNAILDSDQLVAVEFYAPWCGHCQRLAPEWKKAATNLKGLVSVGAVNCDVETNKGLCATYEIKGFPTIKVFSPELKRDKRTGQLTKVPTDYQGPRDAKSIVDFLLSYQPSNVLFVKWNEKDVKSKKSISLDSFLQTKNESLSKVLLFTNKPTTTPLYKALSVDFKDRLLVGEVKHSEKNIIKEFNIQSFPTLVVISPEHGILKYEGKLNHESIKAFLNKHALPKNQKKPEPVSSKSSPKQQKEPKKVMSLVNDELLNKHCLNASRNTVCVIAMTDEDNRESVLETLNYLKDRVKSEAFSYEFGWIHADQSKDIINTLQMTEDYPSIFILYPHKHLYRNYIGSWSENNLEKWLNQVGSGRIQAWPYKGSLKLSKKLEKKDEPNHDEL
ncbi:uncharacterized protein BX663DRAFT_427969 [Cokeromyces recurvatus]|uniref:uncharacterized protein n=1 Tax=Cokeromyces recurvatus TaxID=90255 RepID=UPI00221E7654|nr:uncharacterized protein BX663DRAFT_427969 [Cokeromyces recurvatus]KAI7906435.1 hypothetical protein BX663DRAFT_427969 [Cokeromyces recurvatus]